MKTTASISLAIAILIPASLCAAEAIRIETKILESEVTRIPHDLAEVAKMEGVEILTAPSITTGFSKIAKVEILRNDAPPTATQRKLESPSPGLTISVTPERQGEDIAFNGCLTMTELVGEANRQHQTQSETVTRTVCFSGKQKEGEEGWFDLIDPTNGSVRKKITVWIRFEQPKDEAAAEERHTNADTPPHAEDTTGPGWKPLFADDLSNADKPANVWSVTDGVLTANADRAIWTQVDYGNFTLDLEFKNDEGTNSGVILYCTDTKQWIPNSVEIQIADPFAEKWAKAHPTWHGGGVFGHLAPTQQVTRKPGEWNRMTIQAHGQSISVWLNGTQTVSMDLAKWTSNKTNPDGSAIPGWLNIPKAELPTKGRIGLQGKHGPATIWFRNIRIREDAPAGGSKP